MRLKLLRAGNYSDLAFTSLIKTGGSALEHSLAVDIRLQQGGYKATARRPGMGRSIPGSWYSTTYYDRWIQNLVCRPFNSKRLIT